VRASLAAEAPKEPVRDSRAGADKSFPNFWQELENVGFEFDYRT